MPYVTERIYKLMFKVFKNDEKIRLTTSFLSIIVNLLTLTIMLLGIIMRFKVDFSLLSLLFLISRLNYLSRSILYNVEFKTFISEYEKIFNNEMISNNHDYPDEWTHYSKFVSDTSNCLNKLKVVQGLLPFFLTYDLMAVFRVI